ncbi:unnamed protein product, partial [Oppiella nova]
MKSESLVDNQSMDSCETSIQCIPSEGTDSMCQMNGNSLAAQSPPLDPQTDGTVKPMRVEANSWTIESQTMSSANGSVSVEQQTQTDLIDDCPQLNGSPTITLGSATQSLIQSNTAVNNNTINANTSPNNSSLNNNLVNNKSNCITNTISSNHSVSTSTTTTPTAPVVANNAMDLPKTTTNTNQTNTATNAALNQPKRLH